MVSTSKIMSHVKDLATQLTTQDSGAKAAPAPDAPSWVGHVAVLTGVLAALTGFLTVRATTLTNQAIYESNQAILSQTQASDDWAEYEADSVKAHIVEMQLLPSVRLSAEDRAKLTKMDNEIRNRQPATKQAATAKIQDRQTHLAAGTKNLQQKDLLEYASMLAQAGIALASIAAVVRKRIAFDIGVATAVGAIGLTGYVVIASYLAAH